MTIESQSQLLNPLDKMAAKVDRDFKKAVQKQLPTTFDVVVYCDFETEDPTTSELPAVFNTSNPFSVSNFKFFRARSLAGHHDHIIDPAIVKNKSQREALVASHFQAKIRIDHPNISQVQNGSIWNCTYVGGELVQLNDVVQPGAFAFTEQGSKIMGPNGTFLAGAKKPLLEVIRQQDQLVEIIYKSDALRNEVASKPHYKKFFEEFQKRLSSSRFNATSIQVNSLTRTPSSQASAMVYGRFGGDSGKPISFFKSWFKRTYGTKYAAPKELWNLINSQTWANSSDLTSALASKIQEQFDKKMYVSGHLKSGAVDFNSNKHTYENVITVLEVLSSMKSSGYVSYYNWEGVADVDNGKVNRQNYGVFDYNEHIHINVTKSGGSGE